MLLSCGDALIDFLPVAATDGRDALVPVVGGSCLNIAVGLARLGAPHRIVGGISTDLFGRMVARHAQDSGVDLRFATRSDMQTTLAFVRHVDGEPQYAFYDATDRVAELGLSARRDPVRRDRCCPCRLDHTGRSHGGSGNARHGARCAGRRHRFVRSELQARPLSRTRPAMSIAWLRSRPQRTSSACRTSISNSSMAAAITRKRRGRGSPPAPAWWS